MYAVRWLKTAVIYFVIGVTLGLAMSMSGNHQLTPVHVHVNLLGWVSMGIFAVVYQLFPALNEGKLAAAHFWVYQIALPVMMLALTGIVLGNPLGGMIIPFGATPTVIAIWLFAAQVWVKLRSGESAVQAGKRSA